MTEKLPNNEGAENSSIRPESPLDKLTDPQRELLNRSFDFSLDKKEEGEKTTTTIRARTIVNGRSHNIELVMIGRDDKHYEGHIDGQPLDSRAADLFRFYLPVAECIEALEARAFAEMPGGSPEEIAKDIANKLLEDK